MTRRGRRIFGVFAATLTVLAAAASLVYWKNLNPRPVNRLSNMVPLRNALLVYLVDNGDRFPIDTSCVASVRDLLQPYTGDRRTFWSDNKTSPGFLGNGFLGGTDARFLREPWNTLLFFDSAHWRETPGRVTCFTDTHVGVVREPDFQLAGRNRWVAK